MLCSRSDIIYTNLWSIPPISFYASAVLFLLVCWFQWLPSLDHSWYDPHFPVVHRNDPTAQKPPKRQIITLSLISHKFPITPDPRFRYQKPDVAITPSALLAISPATSSSAPNNFPPSSKSPTTASSLSANSLNSFLCSTIVCANLAFSPCTF